MKLLSMSLGAALIGTAATAHSGGHLHPHGSDALVVGMIVTVFAVAAVLALRR